MVEQLPPAEAAMHGRSIHRLLHIKLLLCIALAVGGAIVATVNGNVRSGDLDHKLIALSGVVVFVIFIITSLHIFTKDVKKLLSRRLGAARASTVKLILRVTGYVAIFITTLGLLAIPIEKLLLGGAVTGIILGVAAQQSLANFFAGIVLIVSRPFSVGQAIRLNAGALGGEYVGTVIDMGLIYVRVRNEEDDAIVLLPNAGVLAGAVTPIVSGRQKHK